jgi:hypothetical protein
MARLVHAAGEWEYSLGEESIVLDADGDASPRSSARAAHSNGVEIGPSAATGVDLYQLRCYGCGAAMLNGVGADETVGFIPLRDGDEIQVADITMLFVLRPQQAEGSKRGALPQPTPTQPESTSSLGSADPAPLAVLRCEQRDWQYNVVSDSIVLAADKEAGTSVELRRQEVGGAPPGERSTDGRAGLGAGGGRSRSGFELHSIGGATVVSSPRQRGRGQRGGGRAATGREEEDEEDEEDEEEEEGGGGGGDDEGDEVVRTTVIQGGALELHYGDELQIGGMTLTLHAPPTSLPLAAAGTSHHHAAPEPEAAASDESWPRLVAGGLERPEALEQREGVWARLSCAEAGWAYDIPAGEPSVTLSDDADSRNGVEIKLCGGVTAPSNNGGHQGYKPSVSSYVRLWSRSADLR